MGLRQNCKQNYIFITVRLPYDVAKISPKSRQDCYTISPKSPGLHYVLAKILPGLHYDLAKILPRSRQNLAEFSPQLQYDVSKTGRIAIRSHHSCSRMSPRLAELQYDLATVALLCLIDSQDCNTISPPQFHYDVHKTSTGELHTVILCIFHRVVINNERTILLLSYNVLLQTKCLYRFSLALAT